ncbi:hypothetical protein [Poseidonocella sp. HB161398]|uniref:hypothetical protein n=1 Tax=Poseidonocella sp. HB161398 TaxID=2320855 RepID=UPI001108AB71|nr:hypothetical protein [Poseidonocella sp. HB161398]
MELHEIITACNRIATVIEGKGWVRGECRLTAGKWDHGTFSVYAAAHDDRYAIYAPHNKHGFGEDPAELLAEIETWAEELPRRPSPEDTAAERFATAVADARSAGLDPAALIGPLRAAE